MIRAAINGYGRIGRCLLHALYERELNDQIEIVAINDPADYTLIAHLTQFDSSHGAFPHEVDLAGDKLYIDNAPTLLFHEPNPNALPWRAMEVDLVFECSGKFTNRDKLMAHIEAGAPSVLVSCPVDGADLTVVYGVNHQQIEQSHQIISNASCTTNCLAPMLQILHDGIGVESASMTTIHSFTNDQHLLDAPAKDPYRARAATLSMIPTKTGAAKAIDLVIPELAGRISGMAVRVPTPNVSLVDLHLISERATTVDEVNELFKSATTAQHWQQVLSYNQLPLVSVDFNHHPASSVFDANHTAVNDRQVKVMAWYDNEWGFSNRLLDVALYMRQGE